MRARRTHLVDLALGLGQLRVRVLASRGCLACPVARRREMTQRRPTQRTLLEIVAFRQHGCYVRGSPFPFVRRAPGTHTSGQWHAPMGPGVELSSFASYGMNGTGCLVLF